MSSNDEFTLETIGAFREIGAAIHWLHPRKKAPIGNAWQEAPVATVEELRATHKPGNNVGVRLGEPSHLIDGSYLHLIDIDIRDAELAGEAWEKFAELFPGVDPESLPCVMSGSGGESRHLYFTTDKPFYSKKLAVSEGKHRTYDKKKKRDVWHYDWEIELFGTSKQAAMPPSIHPDTLKPYEWIRDFPFEGIELGCGPSIDSAAIERIDVAETTKFSFEDREPLTFKQGQLERELEEIPIEHIEDYHDWVALGMALHHQFGGSDRGYHFWVECSKRDESGFAQNDMRDLRYKYKTFGRNRRQPVTMATVRQWVIDARAAALVHEFDDLDDAFEGDTDDMGDADDIDAMLGGPEPEKKTQDDMEALLGAKDDELPWQSLLDHNEEGAIRPNLHNVELIVRNDPRLVGLPRINEFTQETVQRDPPGHKAPRRKNAAKPVRQLSGRVWEVEDRLNGELWSDDRDFAVRSILEAPHTQGGYGIKVSDRDLRAATVLAASDHAFHPVREYLESHDWDGNVRAETLFIDYLGAEDNSYNRDIARMMLIGAVARIYEPGHKFDFAVIIEGLQGKGKSTFIKILGQNWFAELDGDFHDSKQMIELMQGAWIMEIPELSGFTRSDVRAIKAFISRQKDKARLAYARRAGEFPRQCIFIGSTNDREYLKDDTGGRRFWPIMCNVGMIDFDRLKANIDQIWAEAKALYREMRKSQPHGDLPLFLSDDESRATAERLQESRRVESVDDAVAGRIEAWLDLPVNSGGFDDDEDGTPRYRQETCLQQIWVECMGGDIKAYNTQAAQTLGRSMKRVAGWMSDGRSHRFPMPYGKQRVYFRTPDNALRRDLGFTPTADDIIG